MSSFFDFDSIQNPNYVRRTRRASNMKDHLMNRPKDNFADEMKKMWEKMNDTNEQGTENSSVPGFLPGGY